MNRKEVNGIPRFPLDYSVPVCPASHMLSSDSKKRHCFLLALRTGCPGNVTFARKAHNRDWMKTQKIPGYG